jgi:hypothetical protein
MPHAEITGASDIAPRPTPTVFNSVRRATPRRVNVVPIVFVGIRILRVVPRSVSTSSRHHRRETVRNTAC